MLVVVFGLGQFSTATAGSSTPRVEAGLEAVGARTWLPADAVDLGPQAGRVPITLGVSLAPRDPAELDRFVAGVSTPGDPSYRRYLRRGSFGRRFGPTLASLHAVVRTLQVLGVTAGPPSANRLLVPIRTTVGRAERAFHTSIDRFRLPSGRLAFGNVGSPMLPSVIAPYVQTVVGLSDVVPLQPAGAMHLVTNGASQGPALHAVHRPVGATTGPTPCASAQGTGAATADTLASAYGLNGLYGLGDLGQGERIALFEPAAFASSDIAAYQACYKTSTSVTVIPVDGGASVGDGTLEATSDVEDLIGLAPKAAIRVYETANYFTPDWLGDWARIVDDDAAQVISTSWLACESYEPSGFAAAERVFFAQAAAQGETVLAATGD